VATNKLINLHCLLLVDLPEFEVSKSFLFTHVTNFEDPYLDHELLSTGALDLANKINKLRP
jgi:hypothetical protein